MKSKNKLLGIIVILTIASLACGITLTLPEDAIQTGPPVTDLIQIPAPSSGNTANIKLSFGTGKLIINPANQSDLLTGTATYNVTELAPQVMTVGSTIELKTGTFEYELTGLPNFTAIENEWDLSFNQYPMTLEIRAGAFTGEFELGNLALEELRIFGGASKVNINFSSPNLIPMSYFHLTSGITNANLIGLANANFSLFDFEGAGGNYLLDFSGLMQRDATIDIKAGLSNIKIVVPEGVPAFINIEGGLNNINISGAWTMDGENYIQYGEGPGLTFNIDLGAGILSLKNN